MLASIGTQTPIPPSGGYRELKSFRSEGQARASYYLMM